MNHENKGLIKLQVTISIGGKRLKMVNWYKIDINVYSCASNSVYREVF